MLSTNPRIGFIGFGEVGFHVSCGLKQAGVKQISAYTRGLAEPEKNKKIRRYAEIADVELVPTLEILVKTSDLIISAAHAKDSLEIASETAQFIAPDAIFADLNNTIPTIKKQGAAIIGASGARYVDIALVEIPALVEHRALMYASGSGAAEFGRVMNSFGMNIEVLDAEAGQAATIKTLMNIYLKGMQALSIEVALCAYKANIPIGLLSLLISKIVEDVPDKDEMAFWIGRGVLHAHRKAAEVQDIMKLMQEWGVDSLMMQATAERLESIAQYDIEHYVGENLHPEDSQSIFKVMEQIGPERGIKLR